MWKYWRSENLIFTGFEHIFDQGSTAEATSGSSQVDTNMVELVSSLVAKLIHQGFLSNMKWFDENGNEKMKAGKKKKKNKFWAKQEIEF